MADYTHVDEVPLTEPAGEVMRVGVSDGYIVLDGWFGYSRLDRAQTLDLAHGLLAAEAVLARSPWEHARRTVDALDEGDLTDDEKARCYASGVLGVDSLHPDDVAHARRVVDETLGLALPRFCGLHVLMPEPCDWCHDDEAVAGS